MQLNFTSLRNHCLSEGINTTIARIAGANDLQGIIDGANVDNATADSFAGIRSN